MQERGRNLIAYREALPAQPETGFQHVQGIGFVDGRQSRYGESRRTTHHTIHRRLTRDLTRVAMVKKHQNGIRL